MRDEKGRFIKGFNSSPATQFKKGHIPWITGKKGIQGHWKGKKFSKEHCNNMAKAVIGKEKQNSRAWKGGRVIQNGYICILRPNHPFPYRGRYVPEHRLIIEIHLNRSLKKGEVVHHIDENPLNNDINNLMVFRNSGEHQKYHALLRKKLR